ncbi:MULTISPECIES: M81 family metallopeptidase [unclassified Chelatococcus]|uniref:M81 family metallopeptidase n=1 Tax=unclassified Chelatococcus TaxID=2638111 RepID=UPI001BD0BDBC|nr:MULTISPECIES: M81 family metallopeptidase [unclassified Chelatococcus]CAH1656306.1 Microcystin degradation protein MlrC [Hyphomicrobiales bacterium]MBS7742475.1 M81 family metallopeptidase [Chelatococcus sp. HY11]MBX3542407.1 M81 family metallopeptidase [Chelatococcus sp.]MCO5075376.1 M81 family metallopeptidase [Chelatococcus sp.]CAH1695805.1 Microcystin degradation protein MlrC [Hyphomicrobiales bacterium]
MNRAALPQPRVMVARIFHESHGFSPIPTPQDCFLVSRGEAVLSEARGSGTTLGGIISALDAAGVELIPVLSASAPPSGLVEHDFYLSLKQEILAAVEAHAPDAIALELHGAMGTTVLPDAEGDLLRDLRLAIGPDGVIGVGLDLHAHLTEAMLAASDICIACKENPHSDVVACGEKVARGILSVLAGSLHPVRTLVKVPMLLPGGNETATGPLRDLHDMARDLSAREAGMWDISLYNVFRFLDDAGIGQAVVVTSAEGTEMSARAAASELGEAFWRKRGEFVDDLMSIDEALDHVAEHAGTTPYVLADMGDRVLAGAPGDSTAILTALLSRSDGLRAAVPITDAVSVARAQQLGPGAIARFQLGGGMTPGFQPIDVEARVVRIGDGMFNMRGPYRGGEPTALGPVAVLEIDGRVSVLVTSKPGFTHDPAAFEDNGIMIADQDCIVVKSGYHFTLNFAGLAKPLMLRTPGIGYFTQGMFNWTKGRFWPEHDVGPMPVGSPVAFPHARGEASPPTGQA